MSDKLQPYEISIWDDVLVEEEDKSYYKEVKIATIGSDVMTAPSRAINPIFTANVNGEITLTFNIVHRYYDPLEDDYIYNPLEKYLVNERKVKLFYDNKWYDFVIKSCEEDSDSNTFSFTAKGLFVNELGKVGYSIVLSNDLKNNQGTIFELAEKAVKGTDWVIDKEHSDIIQQFVAEPLYIYKNTAAFNATKLNPDKEVSIAAEETLYLFYSSIANKQAKYVQFLRQEDFEDSTLDDNNVAQMPNYRFAGEANYDGAPATVVIGDEASGFVTLELQTSDDNSTGINSSFQGYRLAYNQIVGFDTVKDRPVTLFEANYEDGSKKTIYKYTDYEYVTSDVVTSYITDGSGFNVYGQDGGLEGWSNVTPTNKSTIIKSLPTLKIGDKVGSKINVKNLKQAIPDLRIALSEFIQEGITQFSYKLSTELNNGVDVRYVAGSNVSSDQLIVVINNVSTTFTTASQDASLNINVNLGTIQNIIPTPQNAGDLFKNALKPYVTFSSATEDDGYVLQSLDLTTYPNIGKTAIVDLDKLNGIKNFMRIQFKGVGGPSVNYNNMIYNSGIDDSRSLIGSFSKGEEYVFRIAYGTTEEDGGEPLAISNQSVRAVVAKYTLEAQQVWNQQEESYETMYLYTVDPKNVLFEFNKPFTLRNNEVTGGTFRTGIDGKYEAYIKDGVSVTPSIDYCYVEEVPEGENIVCVWDLKNNCYKVKDPNAKEFLDYYYTTALCKKAISNTELSEEGGNYGVFLYTEDSNLIGKYVCIKEVQLFKAKRDADGELVLIGNIPKSTSLATDYYYLKPEDDTVTEESIETYASLDAIADAIGVNSNQIKPLYNENYEKISSIEASQSNCFNIIQDLCEAFECWARFDIDHEENGAIRLNSDGAPSKRITFHKYSGDDNFAGFKYGINLQSIQRTIESDEFVSKLIVEQVENDTVEGGTVSIAGAPSNPSGETYILNMSYYLNQGLIEKPEEYYKDYNLFIAKLKEKNLEYTAKKTQLRLAAMAREKAKKNTNVYQELIKAAEKDLDEVTVEFKNLTGLTYEDYTKGNGYSIVFEKTLSQLIGTYPKMASGVVPSYYKENGEEILLTVVSEVESENTVKRTYAISSENEGSPTISQIHYIAVVNHFEGFDVVKYDYSYSTLIQKDEKPLSVDADIVTQRAAYVWEWSEPATPLTLEITPSKDNETLINLVGKIYTDNQVKDDYGPLLTSSKQERDSLNLLIDGTDKRSLTVSTYFKEMGSADDIATTKEVLDDYIEGLKFSVYKSDGSSYWEIESSNTEKTFSQDILFDRIKFTHYPENYQLKYKDGDTYYTTTKSIVLPLTPNSSRTFNLIPIEEKKGIKDYMEDILNEKDAIEQEFYTKYSRFIQEGSWTSSDYIDNELYYLDALNVSRVNGQPKVSYNLSVYEVSEQEGLQNYKFNVGDKTYIEDTQFFGYHHNIVEKFKDFVATNDTITLPRDVSDVLNVYQIVSGEGEFDHQAKFIYYPDSNTIEITEKWDEESNDYIVRLSYNILTPVREEVVVSEVEWYLDDPSENSITIQNYKTQFDDLFQRMAAAVQSVEYNSASYSRAASMLDEGGFINAGLLLKSLNELSGGFSLSGDNTITAGPDGIIIKDLIDPTRQMKLTGAGLKTSTDDGYNWNTIITPDGLVINTIDTQNVIIKDGDNPSFRWDTYGLNAYGFGEDKTDLKTYVRFDKYGLYGVQNGENFQANSLEDVKDTAQFGLLWDGFFIKNSYTDGYVSISSDNDFQVVANDQERIKIGALEKNTDGSYEYGIRIKNNDGVPVFITDDSGDIEMTGVVNAKGGTFTDEVRVGNGNNSIILRGTEDDALIGSSQYFEDSSKGWVIKSDGNAVFNNITARGAIKTAVFEYSEIEAVGGIFMFRPSSTIRTAEIPFTSQQKYRKVVPEGESPTGYTIEPDVDYYTKNGEKYELEENPVIENIGNYYIPLSDETVTYSGDLLVTVENPLLFKVGDWCKVSNYSSNDPQSALSGSGLSNVFEITNISNSVLTLEHGAEMFDDVINPTTVIDDDEILATGAQNIYTLTDVTDPQNPHSMENLTEKYFYDILIIGDNRDSVNFATGTPKTLLFTDRTDVYPINYLGNFSLWNHEDEYDTGENYLFIVLNNQTYLYVGEGNQYYSESGNNEDINFLIQKSLEINYEVGSLVGGALISFGNLPTHINIPQALSDNYGIGINSSDNAVNLPDRAISLFETEIYPDEDIKVGYKFKGILGKIPNLGSDYMSPAMNHFMAETQGIYTNNMYIGDNKKYVAFYHYKELDEDTGQLQDKTNLRVVADEFVVSGDDSDLVDIVKNSVYETVIEYCLSSSSSANTHSTVWMAVMPSPTEDYPYIWQRTRIVYNNGEIKYVPDDGIGDGFYVKSAGAGNPGEDALLLKINSSNGDFFRSNDDSSVLSIVIFKGSTEITSQSQLDDLYGQGVVSLKWTWKNYNENDFIDVPVELLSNDGFTFSINGEMISYGKVFQCELIYNEEESNG